MVELVLQIVDFPAYDISTIRTGQFTADGEIWQGEIDIRKME